MSALSRSLGVWGKADGVGREKEAAYLEKMGDGIAKGTAWERITELIGLENSREWIICRMNPCSGFLAVGIRSPLA